MLETGKKMYFRFRFQDKAPKLLKIKIIGSEVIVFPKLVLLLLTIEIHNKTIYGSCHCKKD